MATPGTGRGSLFSGLLLILFGVIFLLRHWIPGIDLGHVLRHYWPFILILIGVAKLWDSYLVRREGGARPAILTGGEAALILGLLALAALVALAEWIPRHAPGVDINNDIFARRASSTEELEPVPFKSGSAVNITTPRGGIIVYGDATDHVSVVANKSAAALSDAEAQQRLSQLSARIETVPGGYEITSSGLEGSSERTRVDLEVHVPRQAKINASTHHGDVNISDVAREVSATTQNGAIEVDHAGGNVTLQMQKGNARVTDAAGDVRITGRGDEVDISGVRGDALIQGDFFGPIRIEKVGGTAHFTSSRTDLTAAQLTGRMELDSGGVEVSDAAGSVKLLTREKDVDIENVAGRVEVSDSKASVQIRFAQPPQHDVSVSDDSAKVELTLPAQSSFEIAAVSRGGEIDSDFSGPSLRQTSSGDTATLNGRVGSRGPRINVTTSYGTIHIRKGE